VQQAVRGSPGDGGIFDIFADDSRAFFIAAAKQVAALVLMLLGGNVNMVVLVWHRISPLGLLLEKPGTDWILLGELYSQEADSA
jgi:hypothetical protein